jgi:ribonuclease HII
VDSFEKEAYAKGKKYVAGVDEAGRGPLAGPVVAAAMIFSTPLPLGLGITDSKKLTPKKRDLLVLDIYGVAVAVGIGVAWHDEVDSVNIHRASLLAMERAVDGLKVTPDFLLVDGRFTIDSDIPQAPLIGGDSKSVSVAAASIIAKTTRDRIMDAYHKIYPGYDFLKNKGYGTRAHIEALTRLGPCPVHRKSFSVKTKRA